MALFIRQDEQRTKIQDRITAELQEKARQKALETDRPDGVEDSAYIKNTKSSSALTGIWIIVAFIAVGIVIWLTVLSTKG